MWKARYLAQGAGSFLQFISERLKPKAGISRLFFNCYMKIKKRAYRKILRTLNATPIETGGILGIRNGVICAFSYDAGIPNDECSYIPNTERLNRILKRWCKRGVAFGGMVHSHPCGVTALSCADIAYANSLLLLPGVSEEELFFPVVVKEPSMAIIPYGHFDGAWRRTDLTII